MCHIAVQRNNYVVVFIFVIDGFLAVMQAVLIKIETNFKCLLGKKVTEKATMNVYFVVVVFSFHKNILGNRRAVSKHKAGNAICYDLRRISGDFTLSAYSFYMGHAAKDAQTHNISKTSPSVLCVSRSVLLCSLVT